MRFILFALILVLSTSKIRAAVGKYPIQHFTPSMYQAGNQNIDFAQNRDMKLFVANNLGVLSYNGIEWTTHAFRTGKKKRSLAFDDDANRLYVGSQGEFGYFEDDWTYTSLIDKIPESLRDFDEVWDVYIHDSEIYFCTFQGIYAYDGQSITVIQNEDGLEKSFYVNDKLYTQSQTGSLFEIKDHKLVHSFVQNEKNQVLSGIIPQGDGQVLFYNSGQIEFSTPFGASVIYEDLIQVLKGTFVNHVLQLSDSRIAVATQTSGLFLYDIINKTIENINTDDGLATNACLRSFQDFEGNLWLGLQNGIALLQINSPMRFINQEINLQGSGYEALETEDGTYYTTSNGIYFSSKKSDSSIFLSGTEGPAYGLQIIGGKLYAGHHTGLFLLERDKAARLAQTNGLWKVKKLRSNPEYAIGGSYSGIYLFRAGLDQNLELVQKIEGFNESSRFFEEDQNGNIWVGQYYKGLYQLILSDDLRKVTSLEVSKETYPDLDQIILSTVDNALVIAANSGIYEFDQSKRKIVNSETFSKFIGDQQVYIFEQDNQKNVHVVAENSVGFFRRISANNYVFVPSSLNYWRYFLNNDLLKISLTLKNGVMFSSNEGFIFYDSKLENQINSDQPVLVSRVFSVTKDTALYSLKPFESKPTDPDELTIHYRDRVLQFDVESYQFNGVYNQQFRYRLGGFSEEYSEWTNSPTKEYSNLREGNYEFCVQTKNSIGEVITSETLKFEITPPFHRSLIAKIIYTILGILALLLLYRIQNTRFKKRAIQLENSKQKELLEKQQKLTELEKEKERAVSKLEEERLESELRHTNNLLAASTMNLVVKNEFIESIKEELKKIRLNDRNPETSKSLKGIVKEIDTTLRIHEDWEQFKLHFDQVHGDFLTRLQDQFIDLSPNEQKLCTLLRLNLNTKEIANMMSISLRGVEVARYRLRKKLELEKGVNLSKFILEY